MSGSGSGTHLEIAGQVSGQVVVGDHNVVIHATTGSTVTLLHPGERPNPARRDHILLLPRRRSTLFGRADEVARLCALLAEGVHAQVYGPAGVGKTALLNHLAHELAAAKEQVVYLNAAGRDVDDLVQDVFEACFDSTGYRPSPVELRRLMAGLRFTLILDDLDLPDDQLATLFDVLPDASVAWSAGRQSYAAEANGIALAGLHPAASMGLIERQLGYRLTPSNSAFAKAVHELTSGLPLHVIRTVAAATRVTDGQLRIPADDSEVAQLLIARLSPASHETLSLLAALAPARVAPSLLAVLLHQSDSTPDVDELVRLGLSTVDDDGYQAVTHHVTADWQDAQRLTTAATDAITWLSTTAAEPVVAAAAGPAIAQLIRLLTAQGQVQSAARLARAAATPVGRSLRWGRWRSLLALGSNATTRSSDIAGQAYFQHEEGVRALALGRRALAGAAFGAAVALWQQLGDTTGAAATQSVQQLALPGIGMPVTGVPAPPTTIAAPSPPAPSPPPGPGDAGHADPAGTTDPSAQAFPPNPPSAPPGPQSAPPPTPPTPPPVGPPAPPGGGEQLVATFSRAGSSLIGKIAVIVGVVAGAGAVTGLGLTLAGGDPAAAGKTEIYYVIASSQLPNMFQTTSESACQERTSELVVCVAAVDRAEDVDTTYRLVGVSLPNGGQVLHWGCKEASPSVTCHIKADRPWTVCVSTSLDDPALQDVCVRHAGDKVPDNPPRISGATGPEPSQREAGAAKAGIDETWIKGKSELNLSELYLNGLVFWIEDDVDLDALDSCEGNVSNPPGSFYQPVSSLTFEMSCGRAGHTSGQRSTVSVQRTGDSLIVTGDPKIAGTYQKLPR